MAEWRPFRDVNNNGYRTLKFTADSTAIAKGVPVMFSAASVILVPTAVTDYIVGITAEAIAASGTGYVWTSGEFYSATGSGGTITIGDWLTWAAATTVTVGAAGNKCYGIATLASISGGPQQMILASVLDAPANCP